ncbi:hypothetical protein EMIHUDRAFT_229711 [Emiliania huxleyi CCMP1516]|uniref:Uncharacterized protein n=2 Tax=Emiliania huxleyi TaxID=2903 RepID=A0A0D3KCA5_EMIH1|nr:hypothetical protein EMIHUDRAFT_229711 [Emiliania huxleyi CCMP1516]EOD33390.1 hypothetical protein EMIHUDRAFT_229711 [Emiliania huxleyi CCMP1516]|eukprot:XP_005785819.1 hypothetical protein EMIHUDRAFT_229711 [Emiliania huxleyi CCMP1516]
MPFDMWALATVARRLGVHCCGRWGPAVLVRLYDATVGSSLASPATTLHGPWLDGSLLSTLPGLCGASPGPLGWAAGPGRAATGEGRAAASSKWRRRRGKDTMAALPILLSTLPTSVAPRGPAAGDAGGEPMRVS